MTGSTPSHDLKSMPQKIASILKKSMLMTNSNKGLANNVLHSPLGVFMVLRKATPICSIPKVLNERVKPEKFFADEQCPEKQEDEQKEVTSVEG